MSPVFLNLSPKNDAREVILLVAALCLFAGALGFARVLIPQEAVIVQAALAKMHSVKRELDNLVSEANAPKVPPLETSLIGPGPYATGRNRPKSDIRFTSPFGLIAAEFSQL